jgi:hypothetical protein
VYVVGSLFQYLLFSDGNIYSLGDIAFLEFGCLVVVEQQVIETLYLSVILERNYLLVKLVKKQSAILDDGSIVRSFKWEERVKLLD